MVKAKKVTSEAIITYYIDYVLENGENPSSVYKFSKDHNFEESEFYQFFSSFIAIEKEIFSQFLVNTLSLLEKNEEYTSFDARHKLLSFYFTFFEMLTANRSYVVYVLNKHKNTLKSLAALEGLRTHFKTYIDSLDIDKIELKQEKIQKIQEKSIQEGAWIQLLITLKFWLDDTSPSFEKTDIFIEKSINTTFDVINTQPLKSILDLGKFIIKEKVPFKV
ncbi:TetR/AcrR family transcriptional regulator [Flavobacteriaceae bacterium AU392]|nr:TetR/AcrR family transcriptional regulator [Flavobacteriaceae bacterium]RKM85890.1 TetR/AcrR family transcriptional regulator [Flavobacteriaceae bacterium AU392]